MASDIFERTARAVRTARMFFERTAKAVRTARKFSNARQDVRKEVLTVRTSYRKEVLALLPRNRKEVLVVSTTQTQATRKQAQEELLLADAKRSS